MYARVQETSVSRLEYRNSAIQIVLYAFIITVDPFLPLWVIEDSHRPMLLERGDHPSQAQVKSKVWQKMGWSFPRKRIYSNIAETMRKSETRTTGWLDVVGFMM